MPDRFDKFSEGARAALSLAQEEAQRLRHPYISAEHLLLALLRQPGSTAFRALHLLGVDPEEIFSTAEFISGWGDTPVLGEIGLTPGAKRAIQRTIEEARRLNHGYIGTELLLGMLRESEGLAAGVLESVGVTLDRARAATVHALRQQADPAASPQSQSADPMAELARMQAEMRAMQARSTAQNAGGERTAHADAVALQIEGVLADVRSAKAAAIDAQLYEAAAELREYELNVQDLLERTRSDRTQPGTQQSRGEPVPKGMTGERAELIALYALDHAMRIARQKRDWDRAARLRDEWLRLQEIAEEPSGPGAATRRAGGFGRAPLGPTPSTEAQHEQDRQDVDLALRLVERATRHADELQQGQRADQLGEAGARLREVSRGLPREPAGDASASATGPVDAALIGWYREARYGRLGDLAATFIDAARENAALAGQQEFAALAAIEAQPQALLERAAQQPNDAEDQS